MKTILRLLIVLFAVQSAVLFGQLNAASRMDSPGEMGQIYNSEATHELMNDNSAFTFTLCGKIQAKGKGELEMYFVERP